MWLIDSTKNTMELMNGTKNKLNSSKNKLNSKISSFSVNAKRNLNKILKGNQIWIIQWMVELN